MKNYKIAEQDEQDDEGNTVATKKAPVNAQRLQVIGGGQRRGKGRCSLREYVIQTAFVDFRTWEMDASTLFTDWRIPHSPLHGSWGIPSSVNLVVIHHIHLLLFLCDEYYFWKRIFSGFYFADGCSGEEGPSRTIVFESSD